MENNSYNYEKPTLIPITIIQFNKKRRITKAIILSTILFLIFYLLMLIPIFFLYPNYNKSIKLNYEKKWFTDISIQLKGDCFRKTQDFRRKCPFPTREIHLNSKHTLVEILINKKWIAYDPCYDKIFDNYNVTQISFDINRNYTMEAITNYPYKDCFRHFHFYHNYYFILLNHTHPYYDQLIRLYYGISN